MSKIKFYQIVMPDNPVSMEYHEISKKSFECVSDIIEIIPFEAVTPESPDFDKKQKLYNWQRSLAGIEVVARMFQGRDKFDEPFSPSERAGMMSHWELLKKKSTSKENFYVMEHDTYLRPEREETFRELLELSEDYDLQYTNIGLFMGCYSVSRRFAQHATHLLLNKEFPINGGPYGVMERLFKTYLTSYYKDCSSYWESEVTFIHPWYCCSLLGMGKNEAEIHNTYNFEADHIKPEVPLHTYYDVPTTQVISKRLKVTQDHREYPDWDREHPWARHEQFHIID